MAVRTRATDAANLCMVASRWCRAYGVSFQLCASGEDLLRLMCAAVPFGTQFAEDGDGSLPFALQLRREEAGFRLLAGEEEFESAELDEVLHHMEQQLLLHVGGGSVQRVFLHAGVVGWEGRAILLPGCSLAGKTTLVAELVRAGATYYSDDYALLDQYGMVHGYARDLQVRQGPGLPRRSVTVCDLAGQAGTVPLAVAEVVFTTFVGGARWEPEPLTPGLAVLAMLQHTLSSQRRPAAVMATLAQVMLTAKASRSDRGEAREVVEWLLGGSRS